ncbi:MAG: hypothetical protein AAGJ54_04020 [Planctomycetota bacterium]
MGEHPEIDLCLTAPYGIRVPSWPRVFEQVEQFGLADDRGAWVSLIRRWLAALASDVEGAEVVECDDAFVVTSLRGGQRDRFVEFFRRGARTVSDKLRGRVISEEWPAVLIDLPDTEQFVDYMASISPDDGEADDSIVGAAMCVREGYVHVVLNGSYRDDWHMSLLHELVHACLYDLEAPLWYEEGLAELLPEVILGYSYYRASPELVRRHREHWRRVGLDPFWRGEAFASPESSELAYHLGQSLTRRIVSIGGVDVARLTETISDEDAGTKAIRTLVGRELAAFATEILGDGDWAASADLWEDRPKERGRLPLN